MAASFVSLAYVIDECRKVVVRTIALCLSAAAAVAVTVAFLTVTAAWFVAAAFSIDPHLSAKAPFGAEQLAFGQRPRIEIAAGDRVDPVEAVATSTATDDVTAEAVSASPAARTYVLASVAPTLPTGTFERANFVRLPDSADDASSGVKPASADIAVAPAGEPTDTDDALVTASISPGALPPKRPRAGEIWLRNVHSRTAVYDIAAHTVHMPDGTRLEAHSGLGPLRDNPAHVRKKMRGPTPPNVYELTMRERLFHGVRAIRLNPARGSTMYGRDGMLAHTYMLGRTGQSNGCVSFKNYDAFLKAFLRGEVTRMVVVPRLGNMDMALLRNAQHTSIE
ncbi:MAG: DUF2778 domain-containing protein [Xanthobacteraceae bacterium]